MPFSLREPLKKLSDVKMANDFAALPIEIAIRDNFDEALSIFKT
jgi:hypothetical protein